MKLLSSNFKPIFERHDDPGDYPNALASGPQPGFIYCSEIEGEARIQAEYEDLDLPIKEAYRRLHDMAQDGCPAQVKRWRVTIKPYIDEDHMIFMLEVEEFDESSVQEPEDV